MRNGRPAVCLPNPGTGRCIRPFHDRHDRNLGGPHSQDNALADINGGLMNGFVAQQMRARTGCEQLFNPACGRGGAAGRPDVMGYHDGADIPNYWRYAKHFVLQDHMFQTDASWSLPEHLFLVSEWSARCHIPGDAMSCVNNNQSPGYPPDFQRNNLRIPAPTTPDYAWTDLTYLLHRAGVSWGYYVFKGTEPDCEDDAAISCAPVKQGPRTPGIWNTLPYFDTVQQDGQLQNVQSLENFFTAAKHGTLPAVSWVVPNGAVSEHPPSLVSAGQSYVTGLINAIMRSPDWKSTAIFVSWDDWGASTTTSSHRTWTRTGTGWGPRARDQPVRPTPLHRPSHAQLRRVCEVHRERLPGRRADRPGDRRPPRSPARRPRGCAAAREHRGRTSTSPSRRGRR